LADRIKYNPDDFDFHYDKPFGRPDKIKNDFISGKADTVLLREPEASFALYNAGTSAHESLSYRKLWNQIDEKNTRLPNAGLIFKNGFLKNHPDIADLFISELRKAIDWVNNNKKEAAMMSYDILRQSPKAVELFLNRAKFEHVPTKDIMDELARYIKIVDKKAAFDEEKMKGLFLY
jgi:NitT/TauT family transport system substrate-binding protein